MTAHRRSWLGVRFTRGRIPPAAVAWRMERVDEVIAQNGNLLDAARAWGLNQSAVVISFLKDRSPSRLDALRSGYRRTALPAHKHDARVLACAMGARLGLTRPEIAALLGISPVALMRWETTHDARGDIEALFLRIGRLQRERIGL